MTTPTASFDFVDCVSRSYRFIWERREDVLRMSLMVVVVKILFFVAFTAAGIENDLLRQGILLMPTYLLEGWVVAQIMVMALCADVSDVMGKRSILPAPEHIPVNTKASMIIYALTKLVLSFVVGMTFADQDGLISAPQPEQDPSAAGFMAAVMILVFMIWAFRFFWLYVPVLMGVTPLKFLSHFHKFKASFLFLGVWLLCFVPLALLMVLMSQVFSGVADVLNLNEDSLGFDTGIAVIQAVIDYALALTSSVAIAYGVYSSLNGENKTTSIW